MRAAGKSDAFPAAFAFCPAADVMRQVKVRQAGEADGAKHRRARRCDGTTDVIRRGAADGRRLCRTAFATPTGRRFDGALQEKFICARVYNIL